MAKTATLTDSFDTIDTGIWTIAGAGTASISTNRLRLDFPVGSFESTDLVSDTTYDLLNSHVLIEIADAGTISTNAQARLYVIGAGTGNEIFWQADQATGLQVRVANGGTVAYNVSTGSGTWSATTHKWLRIRETGGTLFFESSPTSEAWTTHFSTPTSAVTWSLAAVTVQIRAGNNAAGSSIGHVIYDNLNLPLTAPAATTRFMPFFSMFSGSNLITAGGGGGGGGGEGTLMDDFTDFTDVYSPSFHAPAQPGGDNMAAGGGYISSISTPFGQGFEIKAHDLDVAVWNPNTRVMFLNRSWPFNRETTTEHWTFQVYLPTQTLVNSHHAGVLFELDHGASSGHHFSINNESGAPNTFKFVRQSGPGETYNITFNIPIIYDRWFPVVVDCRFSLGATGYLRVWIDGTQWVNYSGPTAFGDTANLTSFMFYRVAGGGNLMSTVRFADIRYTIT